MAEVSKLWSVDQIWPFACFFFFFIDYELKMVFMVLNVCRKKSKEESCFVVEIAWNSNSSAHKWSFTGTQPHPFVHNCLGLFLYNSRCTIHMSWWCSYNSQVFQVPHIQSMYVQEILKGEIRKILLQISITVWTALTCILIGNTNYEP